MDIPLWFLILYFLITFALLIYGIYVILDFFKIRKILKESKKKNSDELVFKDILAIYSKYYKWNILTLGYQTQLLKIYKTNISHIEKEKLRFIAYGIIGFSFEYFIITENYFVHFSRKNGLTFFSLNKKERIKNYLDLMKNSVGFALHSKKAFDLTENVECISSIYLIKEKIDLFSNLNTDDVLEKIKKINNAYESGVLLKEEYENKRKKILDEELGTIN